MNRQSITTLESGRNVVGRTIGLFREARPVGQSTCASAWFIAIDEFVDEKSACLALCRLRPALRATCATCAPRLAFAAKCDVSLRCCCDGFNAIRFLADGRATSLAARRLARSMYMRQTTLRQLSLSLVLILAWHVSCLLQRNGLICTSRWTRLAPNDARSSKVHETTLSQLDLNYTMSRNFIGAWLPGETALAAVSRNDLGQCSKPTRGADNGFFFKKKTMSASIEHADFIVRRFRRAFLVAWYRTDSFVRFSSQDRV